MNPARAMGTFLRVWRSEWAGLSRAQLAIAVAARCKPRKKVTPDIVREWEDGQPPASTAELDSLLQVMRRHGLTNPEVDQFRRAVFAACLDRQYPGQFQEDDLTHRRDCDDLAEAMYRAATPRPYSQILPLVCRVRQLQDAIMAGRGASSGRGEARSRGVALVYLRELLTRLHMMAGRFSAGAAVAASNAAFVEGILGPRVLAGPVSAIGQRRAEAYCRICASPLHDGSWVRRLLSVHAEAREMGEEEVAVEAFAGALEFTHRLPDPREKSALVSEGERLLARGQLPGAEGTVEALQRGLFLPLLAAGRVDEADRHFQAWRQPPDTDPYCLCNWLGAAGILAMAQGCRDEAERYLGSALALADRHGYSSFAYWFRVWLDHCERTRKPLRPIKAASPARSPKTR